MKNNLIFDLGFFNGEDSFYYISKGFNVFAIEANPMLYEKNKNKFKNELQLKTLTLYNKAISTSSLKTIKFYINNKKPEVSSIEKWIAEQEGKYEVQEIEIETTNLSEMISEFGVPYYMKVDVEGMDKEVSRQLTEIKKDIPRYVSFELNKLDYYDIFTNLKICGYKQFQIINQIHNKPNCSGDFGKDLSKNKWMNFDETLNRYMKYRELKIIDNINLGVGWVDLHAKL